MEDVLVTIAVGLVGGVVGGLLGVGGGIIYVPSMVIFLGTDQIVAQGVSLAAVVCTAAVATTQHHRNRTIDYRVAAWMIVPAVGLGLAGAFLAGEVGDEWLKRIFGVVAIVVALRMAYSVRSRPARAPAGAPEPR